MNIYYNYIKYSCFQYITTIDSHSVIYVHIQFIKMLDIFRFLQQQVELKHLCFGADKGVLERY